jgi:pSer/pThr/pTyr-binding forkhead associated (FHA) protein
MTTGSYEEPDWAVQPLAESSWMLTEIKSGVETAKHELYTRSTTIIGRAVDMVHIPLHHESISRQHARISFDSMGQPWLRDLQSSHGSFVNKKKLPRESIGKIESNSLHKGTRGIKLFVGDILTFGASTRYFSLAGEDFTNQQVKLKLPIQQNDTSSPEKSLQNSNNTSKKKEEDEGVSWGMSMTDDDDADSDTDNYVNNNGGKTISMDQQVSEKHRAQLDKLNVMKNKLINLETEDARIRRKGELTEGQEKQLQRNAEREIALKRKVKRKGRQ